MRIRITATPAGEAPEEIRTAWVGLVLSVKGGRRPVNRRVFGVLTTPKNQLIAAILAIFGRGETIHGFSVNAIEAVNSLSGHAPEAAAWWRENTPYLLRPGRAILFNEEACTIEVDPPN